MENNESKSPVSVGEEFVNWAEASWDIDERLRPWYQRNDISREFANKINSLIAERLKYITGEKEKI